MLRYISLLILLTWTFEASAQDPSPNKPANSESLNRVHYGDVLDVDVIGSFEYDWRGGLNPEGFLDKLDKIAAPVYALCRTEEEIAAQIEAELTNTLKEPKVAVNIIDRSGRAVAFLDGAVRSPHRFQIKRPVNLNELIVLTGGITDSASGEITIFRPASVSCDSKAEVSQEEFLKTSRDSGGQTLSVKISELLKGNSEANPAILSGDIVTVIEAFPIYIIGGVKAPKQISARSQMTLTRAIAAAGGLSKNADGQSVRIFRRTDGNPTSIAVSLSKIEAGEEADPVLKPYDIVDVPQKGQAPKAFPPVIERAAARRSTLVRLPLRIVD